MTNVLVRIAALAALVFAVSPRARSAGAAFMRSHGYYLAGLLAALWLSLGPEPQVLGRPLELFSPYGWLYDHLPGFNGVRAPARLGMIVMLMLAVLGGWGAVVVERWAGGRTILVALSLFFLGEGLLLPFAVNRGYDAAGYHRPEQRLHPPASAPAIYHRLRDLPEDAVVVELPLGEPSFDLRAMYYSTVHWRRLANGYSGYFPKHYPPLVVALRDIPRFPDVAWEALGNIGATHVIVHERAFLAGGPAVTQALEAQGAKTIFRDGTDVLVALR